jgi:hypothetical protein
MVSLRLIMSIALKRVLIPDLTTGGGIYLNVDTIEERDVARLGRIEMVRLGLRVGEIGD